MCTAVIETLAMKPSQPLAIVTSTEMEQARVTFEQYMIPADCDPDLW